MVDEGDRGQCGPPRLAQAQYRRHLEEELRDLSSQVAALGRSLAAERGRGLAAGGALRALEIAVGGAQARVGGAYRARDRAYERLRQQQEAGHMLWAELEAARAARAGVELRAQEAELQCRAKEAQLEQLRQAVEAAQHARRRVEQERDDMAAHVPRPPSPTGGRDPAGLQAALDELREHNQVLQQRLQQRQAQVEELRQALAAAGAQAREAARARDQLEQEQRVLRERLQHPGVPHGPTEATLRARCLHLQELLHREAGARAALSRAARAAGRRLRVLMMEVEEQRLRGERYRLQAQASEALGRALGERMAAVAAGTARAQAQGHCLRRALEAVGDGAAATARHVAALRARLRCDPLTLSRTVRRMLREEDEDSEDSEDSESSPWTLRELLETPLGSWGGLETAPKEPHQRAAGPGGGLETAPSTGGDP
ncbi:myosin-11-like isoform X1 [Falco biarmicus]|nr:myosin-11-like isoform X3 [Falco rusticolus]XP_037244393.1 myosin-11-like isoform X3 [Falco rusticolus]XP_055664644.1 myosin-11-like isoform X1 [Falco peregrinus]XP_055664645.1 myosin-11-like isoform X1 [Falco peregrinus]XP_056195336.1 myosin-11-like isoform X1 [Falco biarmicus]XP_056195337.1 myosin-11-like isoform X1 [Falco biarmicus]XP_056195338.1 myosin-11-like isoform X1 [Falco biarmicus]